MNFKTFIFIMWSSGDLIVSLAVGKTLSQRIEVSVEHVKELLPLIEREAWDDGIHHIDKAHEQHYAIWSHWYKSRPGKLAI